MTMRLNKTNMPVIEKFIIKSYDVKSQARENKKNFLSIIDVWNVQNEIKDKFNISSVGKVIDAIMLLKYGDQIHWDQVTNLAKKGGYLFTHAGVFRSPRRAWHSGGGYTPTPLYATWRHSWHCFSSSARRFSRLFSSGSAYDGAVMAGNDNLRRADCRFAQDLLTPKRATSTE